MITTSEMKKLEDEAETKGTSKLVLMERAGKGIFEIVKERYGTKKILIVCYHGNNGGDGFTAVRYFIEDGFDCKVLFIGSEEKLKKEGKENYNKLAKIKNESNKKIIYDGYKKIDFNDYDLILDCILGIGVEGEIKEPIATVIDKINSSKATIIAIDVPTGINPDTGKKANKFVNYDLIITMHDLKPGLEKEKTVVVDIGL